MDTYIHRYIHTYIHTYNTYMRYMQACRHACIHIYIYVYNTYTYHIYTYIHDIHAQLFTCSVTLTYVCSYTYTHTRSFRYFSVLPSTKADNSEVAHSQAKLSACSQQSERAQAPSESVKATVGSGSTGFRVFGQGSES